MKNIKTAIWACVLAPTLALAQAPAAEPTTPLVPPEHDLSSQSPAAGAASAPTSVSTSEVTVVDSKAEELEKRGGFHLGVDLDNWLGTGTFVNPAYYSYLATNLTVAPSYAFEVKGVKFRATGTWRGTFEYTLPDTDNGRRFAPYDIRLGLSAPALLKEPFSGITFTPSMGLTIPSTFESWQAGLITAVSLGVGASRSLGKFDFSASFGGGKSAYSNPMNAALAPSGTNRDLQGNLIVISREGASYGAFTGWNTNWSMSAGGSVNFRATEDLSFTVAYTYLKAWKYGATDVADDYTSKTLDSNGNPAAHLGGGAPDRTFGIVAAGYQLNDHYSFGLSLSTIQVPKTADNKGFRFPFFAFQNAADNATSLNFTLSASY